MILKRKETSIIILLCERVKPLCEVFNHNITYCVKTSKHRRIFYNNILIHQIKLLCNPINSMSKSLVAVKV